MNELQRILKLNKNLRFSLWSLRGQMVPDGPSIRVWDADFFTEKGRRICKARSKSMTGAIRTALEELRRDPYTKH